MVVSIGSSGGINVLATKNSIDFLNKHQIIVERRAFKLNFFKFFNYTCEVCLL